MYKKLLLICLIFLLVGCTRVDKTEDYISIINECMKDKTVTNQVSLGYKYYVPKTVKKLQDYDYNQVFLMNKNKIYLYVDIISYYYKKELNYEKNENAIYFEKINNNGKTGYIEITKEDEKYYVKMLYNYSKIEAYANKETLTKTITTSSIILNNIKYNKKLIERVVEGNYGEFAEKKYEVKKPNDAENSFSQYLEEYAKKDKKEEKKEEKKEIPDK